MCNQIKVTFFKFRHFPLFYLVALFMAAFGVYVGLKLSNLDTSVYITFQLANCDTSILFMVNLVTAWFVGRDFGNRTINHEITSGYSRWSVMMVRQLPVMLSAVILHYITVFSAVFTVACKTGFPGCPFQTQDIYWCLTVMLQLIALQSIIVLISFLCAKPSAAIAATACFTFVTCNALRNFLDKTFYTKTVFYLAENNAKETLIPAAIVAVITLVSAIAATYLIFRKKEIP